MYMHAHTHTLTILTVLFVVDFWEPDKWSYCWYAWGPITDFVSDLNQWNTRKYQLTRILKKLVCAIHYVPFTMCHSLTLSAELSSISYPKHSNISKPSLVGWVLQEWHSSSTNGRARADPQPPQISSARNQLSQDALHQQCPFTVHRLCHAQLKEKPNH